MAWNSQTRVVDLTIPAAQVGSGGVTNDTRVLTEANFPSEMLDADGPYACNSNGSDIRVATAADGSGLLFVDVIAISLNNNPALSTIKARVGPMGSNSSAVPNVYYCAYHDAGAAAQTGSSAYHSKWDSYWPDGIGTTASRTSSARSGSAVGSPGTAAGKIGLCSTFTGGSGFNLGNSWLDNFTDVTVIAWDYTTNNALTNQCVLACWNVGNQIILDFNGNAVLVGVTDPTVLQLGISGALVGNTTWYQHVLKYAGGIELRGYHNGSSAVADTIVGTALLSTTADLRMAQNSSGTQYLEGRAQEYQIYNVALSAADITTEYNNTDHPNTFCTVGTPIDLGPVMPVFEHHYSMLRAA